jgi:hypothetical protein
MTNTDSDTILAQFVINSTTLTVNVLLDTGALGSDYMSREVSDWFANQGVVFEENGITKVCAAFNDINCQFSNKSLTTDITFLTPKINCNDFTSDTYSLNFKIVDKIQYDVIIGKRTIKALNLWHLFEINQSEQLKLFDKIRDDTLTQLSI